jgi:hypothetical protein
MTKRTILRWVPVLASLLVGCADRQDSGAAATTRVASTGASCMQGGPCPAVSDCAAALLPGTLPSPWWVAAPTTSCVEAPAHKPVHAYDECTPVSWTPSECKPQIPGAIVCLATRSGGYRSVLCLQDGDCPTSMVCVGGAGTPSNFGVCQKTCAAALDCARCDLKCGADGYCIPRDIPGT